jgi:hypothetical protein
VEHRNRLAGLGTSRGDGNDAVGPGQAAHHAGASMRDGERQTMDYFAGNETRTVPVRVKCPHLKSPVQRLSGTCFRGQPVTALPAGQSRYGGQGISRKPDDEPTVREFGQNSWVTWAHGDAVQQQSPTEREVAPVGTDANARGPHAGAGRGSRRQASGLRTTRFPVVRRRTT